MEQQYPEAIAGTFIVNEKGEIVLIKTHKWKDKYCVPGGHIETGETIEQALIREAKEETGLTVYDPKFLCIHEYIPNGSFWKDKHMLFLNFLLRTKSSKVTLNHEAEDYVWATPKEALKLPLEHFTKKTIEEYLLNN